MKFTVNKNDILDVLSKIQGLTGRKSNLAITEAVLIRTSDSEIKLTVTDLETGFEGIYPASIETDGMVAINARKFYEIVRDFPVDEIHINEVENNWIEIGNENVQYNIVGMNPSDFPDTPNIENIDFFKINSKFLKSMIDKSIVISGVTDDRRAHINGVFFETIINKNKKIVRMVSTDGSRLSSVDYIYDTDIDLPSDIGILIPKKGLNEVSKFLTKEGIVQVGVSVKNNNFVIKKDAEIIIIRLLEGEFPEYKDIINKKDVYIINLDKKLFLMMLKRMSILSSENYKGAIFNFSDNKLIITTTNPDIGESKEEITIDFKGEPIEVAFNPRYFIETLNVIDDDRISINIVNKEKPCLIEGESNKSFLSVVMPMRI
ncbi:MAG: DNA polymerase III subunit beta [Proteobacteria bacterium]|nr:DNA polymerase III subunit beta [Pseudomonadota bacterium]MBU4288928.1 DNA polymerase III subunit beta [Pseudomonadota bacterium]MCG2758360.1 DNA polymerase III subunit beta [Desulfobacteraceae bacterium]